MNYYLASTAAQMSESQWLGWHVGPPLLAFLLLVLSITVVVRFVRQRAGQERAGLPAQRTSTRSETA